MTDEKKTKKPAKKKRVLPLPDNVIKFPGVVRRRRTPSAASTEPPEEDDTSDVMTPEQEAELRNLAEAERDIYQILSDRRITPKFAAHMMTGMVIKMLHFNDEVDLIDLICTGVNTEMMISIMMANGEPEPSEG